MENIFLNFINSEQFTNSYVKSVMDLGDVVFNKFYLFCCARG